MCRWCCPEVNADHLHLIEEQSWRKESGGYIVTNSNCTVMGPVLALKPIADRFGIEQIFATSMQAVSGAGYPGVASMDILDNVDSLHRATKKRRWKRSCSSCWARSKAMPSSHSPRG